MINILMYKHLQSFDTLSYTGIKLAICFCNQFPRVTRNQYVVTSLLFDIITKRTKENRLAMQSPIHVLTISSSAQLR
jgi:hypothetical protein